MGSRNHKVEKQKSQLAVTAILEERGQVPVKPESWSGEQPTPDETPREPGHWSRAVSWEICPFSRRCIAFQCGLTMNP